MTENEEKTFRICFGFYAKWRKVIIETDEQWNEFAADVGRLGIALEEVFCQLGGHLYEAVIDGICDLYKGGMKPVPVNYFGRGDL